MREAGGVDEVKEGLDGEVCVGEVEAPGPAVRRKCPWCRRRVDRGRIDAWREGAARDGRGCGARRLAG